MCNECGCTAIEMADNMSELLLAFEELFKAATEYVEYKHSGDPFEEDARVMKEMTLDDLYNDGIFEQYRLMIDELKERI